MDKERSLIIKALRSQNHNLPGIWNKPIPTKPKDSNASVEARKKGNSRYLQKNHDALAHRDIFILYCKSIALAPLESEELALAYGNRSAFLFHIDKYEDCMKDIDKALAINTSNNALKLKLLHRKIECLNKLGLFECRKLYEAVQHLGNDIDGYNDKEINNMISSLMTYSYRNVDLEQEQKSEGRTVRPETNNIQDFVTIQNNEKYGRHLVASKDYKPGDIILVEKFIASSVDPAMTYIICHYCYKTCWSSIPCNSCSWVVFCSEDCRKKAWDAYHDVECALIPFLNAFDSVMKNFGICVRTLIMAVKEVRGLSELKAALQSMDPCNGKEIKEYFINAKNSVRSIYFLKSDGVSEFLSRTLSKALIIPLIGLVKCTELIKHFDYKTYKDFTNNEDVVFLGSLLLKLAMIKIVNSYDFSDEHLRTCYQSKSMADCRQQSCCIKGICLLPMTSLINHSCVPNVGKCFSRDQSIIIYALQPVEKGSQIFISYICNFYDAPASYRCELLKQYNFTCECQACKGSWPALCAYESEFQSSLEVKLSAECNSIFEALNNGKTYFEKEEIQLLSEKITQALKSLKQPSYLTCILDQAMNDVFSRMYLLPQNHNHLLGNARECAKKKTCTKV